MPLKVPVEISARHVHLCKKDLETLFGKGYSLNKKKNLTQPGQFAAEETITASSKNKKTFKIRVVSPVREKTQVEISTTDAYFLGMRPAIRKSGDLKGTPGILLIGPKGKVNLKEGVIVPWRHIHMSVSEAKKIGIKNGVFVSLLIKGPRAAVFHKVRVRVGKDFKLSVHLDTDEGNAVGAAKKTIGELIV